MATRAAEGLKPKSSGAVVDLMMSIASCCHFDVDAGDDLEAAVEDRGRAVVLGELLGHVVDEVVGQALVVVRRVLVDVELAGHELVGALAA